MLKVTEIVNTNHLDREVEYGIKEIKQKLNWKTFVEDISLLTPKDWKLTKSMFYSINTSNGLELKSELEHGENVEDGIGKFDEKLVEFFKKNIFQKFDDNKHNRQLMDIVDMENKRIYESLFPPLIELNDEGKITRDDCMRLVKTVLNDKTSSHLYRIRDYTFPKYHYKDVGTHKVFQQLTFFDCVEIYMEHINKEQEVE